MPSPFGDRCCVAGIACRDQTTAVRISHAYYESSHAPTEIIESRLLAAPLGGMRAISFNDGQISFNAGTHTPLWVRS
jgi:hypothetical protein